MEQKIRNTTGNILVYFYECVWPETVGAHSPPPFSFQKQKSKKKKKMKTKTCQTIRIWPNTEIQTQISGVGTSFSPAKRAWSV